MEIRLRCELDDRPGALARLADAVAEAGGNIQAVDVVESDDGRVLDDLVVAIDPAGLRSLLTRIEQLEACELVHAGPSRGDPGDAVTRLATGIGTLLDRSSTVERGVPAMAAGLVHAESARLVPAVRAPAAAPGRLVVPLQGVRVHLEGRGEPCEVVLVVDREHRFTATEAGRVTALARACAEAALRAGTAEPTDGPDTPGTTGPTDGAGPQGSVRPTGGPQGSVRPTGGPQGSDDGQPVGTVSPGPARSAPHPGRR